MTMRLERFSFLQGSLKKLETIETAITLNFTSGEGLDLSRWIEYKFYPSIFWLMVLSGLV
jgi:hypothetical protein